MAQPIAGYNFKVVSGGVGTVVVSNQETNLVRILVPGTYIGSITFHNSSSAAGTTATSPVYTLGLPTTSVPQSIEVGVWCGKGLTYEATGTTLCTVVWG